ncbi:aminotransferase class V-fold PLP-dependent enzyme [Treponema phagedenis]|uniref:aminotransferase class V-fold PLP-dependent enzyme n=1 Tax=Treponema phagedenis TaxID=162 RepID=UPI0011E619CF|nr:aminotransferase class V-fold PLP-dependent enzyme [Treponema phagedenis]QEJ95121.1 aminotransferase class V-fold PLP-dependent enzyme [Treponema phagedenis]QEK06054.1 aminotransferase class V-fold PLP-dependent enzyme [Treponema phagedenis]
MRTYPLRSLSLNEAIRLQFKVVDCITREFEGHTFLNRGDLGVVEGFNKPVTTAKAEKVIASIFDAEACILLRGAGTGAIRFGLHSMFNCGDKVLVHAAPIYSTSKTSFDMLGLIPIEADFNEIDEIKKALKNNSDVKGVLIQHTRQKPDDRYDMHTVIETIKTMRDIPILTDDNYAVMKVKDIGVQCGADVSCFSSFKLLGPEGVGVIVGEKLYIDRLISESYSGGMQVQGHESIDVLRGLTYAPVSLAIQAQVNEECVGRLKSGKIPLVKDAFIANAQSKVILVEFSDTIAERVLIEAEKLGAAPNPVGAESKYEITPMFYRVSGTFLKVDPTLKDRMIRINPMRAGADTILNILRESVERAR